MRLFVAIDIGPDVLRSVRPLITALRDRARQLAPRARITWVAPDRLHLTLRFIGEVDDARAEAIERVFLPPIAQDLFTFEIAGVGVFPSQGPPRIIWAGVRHEREALQHLEHEVSRRLQAVGVPPAPTPYHPHVTLGRVREAAGLPTAVLLEGFASGSVLGLVEVKTVTLYASRLQPLGPDHRAILQTPLNP